MRLVQDSSQCVEPARCGTVLGKSVLSISCFSSQPASQSLLHHRHAGDHGAGSLRHPAQPSFDAPLQLTEETTAHHKDQHVRIHGKSHSSSSWPMLPVYRCIQMIKLAVISIRMEAPSIFPDERRGITGIEDANRLANLTDKEHDVPQG